LYAQEPSRSPADDIKPHAGQQLSSKTTLPPIEHHFWDKENDLLFAGVAAARTLDYHAGFAFIEAGATGVSIGASYLFHRYGHHKLERWTSIVHIGLASTGAVRNYSLKTAHRATVVTQP